MIRVEPREHGILVVTIDRPERRNALDPQTVAELHAVIESIDGDPKVRVVVLTAVGASFCAGADLKSLPSDFTSAGVTSTAALLAATDSELVRTLAAQELMASLFERIHRMRQPVIAAVNGHATGGGFALALACDIRFASPAASLGAVFIRHGVSNCDMGTSYHLPRLVGAARAAELMLTGRVFDAQEAYRMGLVFDVVPAEELLDAALSKAREIAVHSPLAVWMTKETMWQTVDAPSLRHALDLENRTQVMCTATGELRRSFDAFREGRG
ncbi:enoyl-CoA hydratase/isomerase family protein [Mycobacteroides abscessus]|uniref:enoyl-CoA hydratase/isomerase family protein n=1 Tax=Mycobacteroides abscessus TaxID=36809 RepID=UPI0021044FA2|nr:enoyl-CoA hydratase/isomerase family protein [Mycobacteroides abscessus]